MSSIKSVEKQFEEFNNLTNLSRATFFRYKGYLLRKIDTIGKRFKPTDIRACYFCNKKEGLIIHHIDFNPKNNDVDNRLTLCKNCHAKLHIVFKSITKSKSIIKKDM